MSKFVQETYRVDQKLYKHNVDYGINKYQLNVLKISTKNSGLIIPIIILYLYIDTFCIKVQSNFQTPSQIPQFEPFSQ